MINSASLQDAVHSNRQQLCFTLPAHEYGYIQNTDYYTDTMGTLWRSCMKRSIFMRGWRKGRLTPHSGCIANIKEQNQDVLLWMWCIASAELLFCAFRSFSYGMCAPRGWGGFLMGSMHKQILHTHTHTHLSHQPGKHPCILPLRTVSC